MTDRDWFAAFAIFGMAHTAKPAALARNAYALADEMLAARDVDTNQCRFKGCTKPAAHVGAHGNGHA